VLPTIICTNNAQACSAKCFGLYAARAAKEIRAIIMPKFIIHEKIATILFISCFIKNYKKNTSLRTYS
jgi:hypothetical protein